MALNLGTENIEVICSKDGAIVYDEATFTDYLTTLDESKLKFVEGQEPTRFVLRKVLPFKVAKRIKAEAAKVTMKPGATDASDAQMVMNMSYTLDQVRAALVGVKNPGTPALEYRIEKSDGLAAEDLIALLDANGIAQELLAAWQSATEGKQAQTGPAKKS